MDNLVIASVASDRDVSKKQLEFALERGLQPNFSLKKNGKVIALIVSDEDLSTVFAIAKDKSLLVARNSGGLISVFGYARDGDGDVITKKIYTRLKDDTFRS